MSNMASEKDNTCCWWRYFSSTSNTRYLEQRKNTQMDVPCPHQNSLLPQALAPHTQILGVRIFFY